MTQFLGYCEYVFDTTAATHHGSTLNYTGGLTRLRHVHARCPQTNSYKLITEWFTHASTD